MSSEKKRKVALVRCRGGKFNSRRRLAKQFDTCAAAHESQPDTVCSFGCLGLGDCQKVCEEEAIQLSAKMLPVIDRDKCVGCGLCVSVCPRKTMNLTGRNLRIQVLCRSKLDEEAQKQFCLQGCIGCGRCVIACDDSSIRVTNNLAHIQSRTCILCGICARWCTSGCLEFTTISANFNIMNPMGKI
ncbi:4Fe-4S dicluster-binding protein [Deltaproteobacteria bacterium TL4]